jgi:phosphatidylserine/phosphatidylglycerophosphate/cardiolipin synthase-like enzyme
LVFHTEGAGFLSPTFVLRRQLYPAMVAAGIPRVGATQEKRTFHSLRQTFAKRALERGAQITRRRGDTTSADQLVRAFADRLWRTDWPGEAKPRVFFDPRALDADGPAGVLHAKAVVTDDESVLVTSANLTEAAFDRNIEMGMLYRDRAFALGITSHFRVLIDRKLLMRLPPT